MREPMIVYGTLVQPLHRNAQYLLMEAGITNGCYPTHEFIDRINHVPLDSIRTEEGKRDVAFSRDFLVSFAEMGDTVTISDFNPDKPALERFVNTTFREMYNQLHME